MDSHVDEKKDEYQKQQVRKEAGRGPFEDPFDVDEEFAHELTASDPKKAEPADTEFAAETAAPRINERSVISHRDTEVHQENKEARARQAAMLGWISLILGIGSLFFWQAVLGPAAILTGIFAWIRGSRAFGSWAIVLGLIAVVAYFILVPYYA